MDATLHLQLQTQVPKAMPVLQEASKRHSVAVKEVLRAIPKVRPVVTAHREACLEARESYRPIPAAPTFNAPTERAAWEVAQAFPETLSAALDLGDADPGKPPSVTQQRADRARARRERQRAVLADHERYRERRALQTRK